MRTYKCNELVLGESNCALSRVNRECPRSRESLSTLVLTNAIRTVNVSAKTLTFPCLRYLIARSFIKYLILESDLVSFKILSSHSVFGKSKYIKSAMVVHRYLYIHG